MFFPERIRSIQKGWRVLEIGPGNSPHPRSNVLLERTFDDDEARKQRGGTEKLMTSKSIVFYDGGRFPFEDNEFDYVICSHVIEHVVDVESFCSELFRVSSRGYLEYPTVNYEYLFDFEVHKQIINYSEGELRYLPKIATNLEQFEYVHNIFRTALEAGYFDLVAEMKEVMFQGFEWSSPFKIREVKSVNDLVDKTLPHFERISLARRILQKIAHQI